MRAVLLCFPLLAALCLAADKPVGEPVRATATFAGGSFWHLEAMFRKVPGVKATRVGFTGGSKKNPSYKEVCTGSTGHAEAVEVHFDPKQISYRDLVSRFLSAHNPTSLNRQGVNVGTQYRSAVFYHSKAQQEIVRQSIERMEQAKVFQDPVLTQVVPIGTFWPAAEFHQRYLEKRGLTGPKR